MSSASDTDRPQPSQEMLRSLEYAIRIASDAASEFYKQRDTDSYNSARMHMHNMRDLLAFLKEHC